MKRNWLTDFFFLAFYLENWVEGGGWGYRGAGLKLMRRYSRVTGTSPMGASDKETCFWTFCSWSRVTFKEFRNCVTGKTLDGLLVMTRGDSVVVRLEGVTEPILNMTSVVLLDDSTDAATAGLVWVAFFEIVTPEDFPGVASFGGFGVVMIREGFLVGVGGPPEKVGSRENSSMTDYSARKVFHMAPNGKKRKFWLLCTTRST